MIDSIAFDIGNVLFYFHIDKFIKNLEDEIKNYNKSVEFYNISKITLKPLLFLKYIQPMQDVGHISLRQALEFHYGFADHILDSLVNNWNDALVPNKQMLDLVYSLSKNRTNIVLFSNIGKEHLNLIKEKHPELLRAVTLTHFSCDVGTRKPSDLYFKSFFNDYPSYKNCVYVDDLQENLDSADRCSDYHLHTIRLNIAECDDREISNIIKNIKALTSY